MISGKELIQSLNAMSVDELSEVRRIIVDGRAESDRASATNVGGLRGHNLYLASLSQEQRAQLDSNLR